MTNIFLVIEERKAMAKKDEKKPKVVSRGICIVCGNERAVAQQTGVPLQFYEDDEFCSAKCAREHYGTQLTGTAPTST